MNIESTTLSISAAPTDLLTLMIVAPYTSNKISFTNGTATSNVSSEGFEDISILVIQKLMDYQQSRWLFHTGLSIPVGAIDEDDSSGTRFGYPLQLGSGTYDFLFGTTYFVQRKHVSYGAQGSGEFRFGQNRYDYKLGNTYNVSSWIQAIVGKNIGLSLRGSMSMQDNVINGDSSLNTTRYSINSIETVQVQADIGVGINYTPDTGFFNKARFAFEYIAPVSHYTNSIQLVTDSKITFGVQHKI